MSSQSIRNEFSPARGLGDLVPIWACTSHHNSCTHLPGLRSLRSCLHLGAFAPAIPCAWNISSKIFAWLLFFQHFAQIVISKISLLWLFQLNQSFFSSPVYLAYNLFSSLYHLLVTIARKGFLLLKTSVIRLGSLP